MNYAEIKEYDIANGPGVRLTLFVSGCTHHCPECFNPETWDFNYGKPFTEDVEETLLEKLGEGCYQGLTLLGGDPMEESNQEGLLPLLQRIHKELPEKNIWAYTGYLYDKDLVPGGRKYVDGVTDQYLDLIDVLVDGPFIEAQKKITLNFRGSTNQRIIDLKETRKTGTIVLDPLNN